jgi:hypothetical protein
VDGGGQSARTSPNRLPAWLHTGLRVVLFVGPVSLFVAATAFGILEVHSSTDTWIGLAAGQQIYTADEFPKTDTFSYTFYGNVWYNQNWLTHLFQYWLYSHISPNAVIYGTWVLSALVFVFTLLAAYWRSATWLGALLAASIVALGCRDFLSARPATTGFFCIAALWALICALEGQRDKRRRWPIVLLLPLLLIWGNAHGSFVFAYGVLGLYVGHWFVVRTIRVNYSYVFSLIFVLMLMFIGGVAYSGAPPDAKVRAGELLTLGTATYYKGKLALVCGALVAYAAYWLCIWRFRPRSAVSDRQVAAIVAVVAAALILTVAFGPFHMRNFTHGQKIAGSSVFRQVSEWNPPFERNARTFEHTLKPDFSTQSFPPMARFWRILPATLGLLAAGVVVRALTYVAGRARGRASPPAARRKKWRPVPWGDDTRDATGPDLHISLFDVAVVLIGLAMTFWARRFAPIFYIFGAPVFLTWLVLLLRPLPAAWRRYLQYGAMIGAGVCAYFVADDTWDRYRKEVIEPYEHRPEFNLLERVTKYDATPHDAILFLKENKLNVNIVTEWTQAGPVMFYAPNARVFMDGRAQQVYDEEHYTKYAHLLVSPDTPAPYRMHILDESDSNAVLLRQTPRVAPLWQALAQSPQWVPALLGPSEALFLRRGSRGLEQLGELLRRGEEWRPKTALAMAARGFVWRALETPGPEEAILCWKAALEQNMLTGSLVFEPLTNTLVELGRPAEARELIREYYERVKQAGRRLSDATRRDLLQKLGQCWAEIDSAAPASRPNNEGN